MITSNVKRSEKQAQNKADHETQHRLWVIRIQELMQQKGISSYRALDKLKEEYKDQYKDCLPQYRQELELAWKAFLRRIDNNRN